MVSELAPSRGNASFCFNISLDRPNGGLTKASCTHPRRYVKMLVALVSVANIPPFFAGWSTFACSPACLVAP